MLVGSNSTNITRETLTFLDCCICLGYFEKAVKEHTREVQLSEASQDSIGAAIAHRKVGECLCALKKYKEALFHQNLHLEVEWNRGNFKRQESTSFLCPIQHTLLCFFEYMQTYSPKVWHNLI